MPNYHHIDPNAIDQLAQCDNAVAIALLDCFLNTIDDDVERLMAALKQSADRSIRSSAHRIKTSFLMLGEKTASSYCLKLEHSDDISAQNRLALAEQIVALNQEITSEVSLLIARLKNG